MTTATYRPRVHSATPFWFPQGLPALTARAVAEQMVNATIRELADPSPDPLEFRMDRASHHDALAEIASAVAQLGFTVGETVITEWVSATVECAVGGLGLGAAGGSATKSLAGTAVSAVAGAAAGALVGQFIQIEKARFLARQNPLTGRWDITPLAPPDQPQFRFRYA